MKVVSPIKQVACSLWSEHIDSCFNINIEFISVFFLHLESPADFYSKEIKQRGFLLSSHAWKRKPLGSIGCFQNITVGNKKLLEFLAITDKIGLQISTYHGKTYWQNIYAELWEPWIKVYGCFLQAKWTFSSYPWAAAPKSQVSDSSRSGSASHGNARANLCNQCGIWWPANFVSLLGNLGIRAFWGTVMKDLWIDKTDKKNHLCRNL